MKGLLREINAEVMKLLAMKVFYITLCFVGAVGVLIGGIAGGIWIHRKCCRNAEDCHPEKLRVPRIAITDTEDEKCKSTDVNVRRASTFQDLSNVDIKIVNCEWKSTSDMVYNTPQGMLQPGLYPSSANKEPFSMGRIFFVVYYENQEETLHLFIKEVAFIQGRTGVRKIRNPFIRVYLLPQGQILGTTRVHFETLNPEYNEIFTEMIPYEELEKTFLRFLLCDKMDDETYMCFGHVTVPLTEKNMRKNKMTWRDFERN
ncbi:hypothetical protein TNCT_546341 [Trichonephila clavata]|uniref:C2 domain-containing protein n=1 Tax=Trichonephila clavata TaxID=2740835 RepID=A0A8X6KM68_TRICU|nr:hypothetical protein TNCT_546341 [Trichonephila clavata]